MRKVSIVRRRFAFFWVGLVGLGWLASGVASPADEVKGAAAGIAHFVQLDAAAEQALNKVTALGAQMAILKEAQVLLPENRLLVLVTTDPGLFFPLSAIQLQIDGRMISFHQYTQTELAALQQGGSHRLFWGNVSAGRHQLMFSMMGSESKDADFQRKSTVVTISGENRSVLELRIAPGKDQPLPEMSLKEWE